MSYRFSYRKYRLPLRTPLRTAHGRWAEREGLILRLEDDEGRVGWGEVAPIPWIGSETLAEAEAACRVLSDKPSAGEIAAVPMRLGCVRFALATALAMEATKVDGVGKLPVAALLPAGRPATASLENALAAGFLAFKWKVGVEDIDTELGILDELASLLPAYAKLRLDANGGWSRRAADRWLTICAERPVEFIEQPLAPPDGDGLLGLARDYPVTLALDESIVRLESAREWQGRGWPGVFVIKPALAGPLAEVGDWVGRTKADVVLSSAIETVVGRRAIIRWAIAAGVTKRPLGFGVGGILEDNRWDGPPLGALADTGWAQSADCEELWNGLS